MADGKLPKMEAEALVGGCVALALVETLFDKGFLKRDDARDVLNLASTKLGVHITAGSAGAFEASQKISELLSGKLTQRT